MKRYTPSQYAELHCHGLVCGQTVRNWIRRWENTGGLPNNHSISTLPNGRKIIVIDDQPKTKSNPLVNMILANRNKAA